MKKTETEDHKKKGYWEESSRQSNKKRLPIVCVNKNQTSKMKTYKL